MTSPVIQELALPTSNEGKCERQLWPIESTSRLASLTSSPLLPALPSLHHFLHELIALPTEERRVPHRSCSPLRIRVSFIKKVRPVGQELWRAGLWAIAAQRQFADPQHRHESQSQGMAHLPFLQHFLCALGVGA